MKDKYLWRIIYEEECRTLLTQEQREEIDYKIATYLGTKQLIVARDNAIKKYEEYFPEEGSS